MNKLNLDQPIFVYYIDVRGLSLQDAGNMLKETKKVFSYDNATTWIIPVKDSSKVECIYKPNDKLKNLIDKINSIINDYKIDSPELKILIRDFKIENILEQD
jgi:hypothetical protein